MKLCSERRVLRVSRLGLPCKIVRECLPEFQVCRLAFLKFLPDGLVQLRKELLPGLRLLLLAPGPAGTESQRSAIFIDPRSQRRVLRTSCLRLPCRSAAG